MTQVHATQHQLLAAGLQEVHAVGQGAMTLITIGPRAAAAIAADAMGGDAEAQHVLEMAAQLLRQVEQRDRATALPCILCCDPLWRDEAPAAVGILKPYNVDMSRTAVGLVYCRACASHRPERELAHATVAMLRHHMMPDLRVFAPAAAGHA